MLVSRPRLGIGFKEVGPPLKGKDLLRREAAANLLLQAVLEAQLAALQRTL